MSFLDYFRPKTKQALLRGESVFWIENSERASYIRACVLSFPPWVDKKELRAIWHLAKTAESETGEKHAIDHIIPLNHPRVCGLSVPCNLQVLTVKQNSYKSNHWTDDQLELFNAEV